jgi:peptidoglycan/xylan/chitin deacetylase (PgdA/CDA1 family)
VLVLAAPVGLLVGCGGNASDPAQPATGAGANGGSPPRGPARPRVDMRAKPGFVAARSSVPVLCYHQLRSPSTRDAAVERPYIMSPGRFRSQLDALVRRGYHTISPNQLLSHLTTGAMLPPRPVLLTFDDAVDDQFRIAFPELRRRGMTATFFVMTVVLGHPGYMTRDQVRHLEGAGMTIGAHTWDHHRVDQYVGDDWRIQIDEPMRALELTVGHPIRFFAYPYGVWSHEAFARLRHAGVLAAFQLADRPISFSDPLMTIRRKIASPKWSDRQFEHALRNGFRQVAA